MNKNAMNHTDTQNVKKYHALISVGLFLVVTGYTLGKGTYLNICKNSFYNEYQYEQARF